MTTTKTLKFFYNGIKANGGKLQRAWYSVGNNRDRSNTITIYKGDYERFSSEVHESFKVENNTEIMTDYFEKDRIRVLEDHELYLEVVEAANKMKAHSEKIATRR